ncbi:MAG: hypothetical protein ABIP39_10710 [Polyangiaceae bacterium]
MRSFLRRWSGWMAAGGVSISFFLSACSGTDSFTIPDDDAGESDDAPTAEDAPTPLPDGGPDFDATSDSAADAPSDGRTHDARHDGSFDGSFDGGFDASFDAHEASTDASVVDAREAGPDANDSGCGSTLSDKFNCGTCGHVCPGIGQTADDVSCFLSSCTFTCQGENFDVDKDSTNGCEAPDTVPPGHTVLSAASLGSVSCLDAATVFTGKIVSDARTHTNPAVDGFNSFSGSAPDIWVAKTVDPDAGICDGSYSVSIVTTGGSTTGTCYRLIVSSGLLGSDQVDLSGDATATITGLAGSYTPGNDVRFTVKKTCNTTTTESVSYAVKVSF